jgi:hypothetical protein
MLGLAGIGLGYLRLHDEGAFSPLGFGTPPVFMQSRSAELIKEIA